MSLAEKGILCLNETANEKPFEELTLWIVFMFLSYFGFNRNAKDIHCFVVVVVFPGLLSMLTNAFLSYVEKSPPKLLERESGNDFNAQILNFAIQASVSISLL